MPWNRYVIGYHGCSEDLVDAVVAGRKDLEPSNNNYDWLGTGRYFWEESPRRALEWARETGRTTPAVLGAVIDLGRCLDLTRQEHLDLVKSAHSRLIHLLGQSDKPLPRNSGREMKARKLDCAVINALHLIREEEGLEPFDTVRAFFVEGEPLYKDAGFRTLDHLQICVRDTRRIIGYFRPRSS